MLMSLNQLLVTRLFQIFLNTIEIYGLFCLSLFNMVVLWRTHKGVREKCFHLLNNYAYLKKMFHLET